MPQSMRVFEGEMGAKELNLEARELGLKAYEKARDGSDETRGMIGAAHKGYPSDDGGERRMEDEEEKKGSEVRLREAALEAGRREEAAAARLAQAEAREMLVTRREEAVATAEVSFHKHGRKP